MPMRAVFVTILIASIAIRPASAAASMTNARIAAHYKPKFVPTKSIPVLCDNPSTPTIEPNYSPNYDNLPCHQYTVQGPLGPGQVYAVVGRAGGEGVAAASFGVEYSGSAGIGVDPRYISWTSCTDGFEYPNAGANGEFPASGGGLRITWLTCQYQTISSAGVHAVIGSFYVYAYSDDVLNLMSNNNLETGPELSVADCAGVETNLLNLLPPILWDYLSGSIGFGSRFGNNACFCCLPVQTTTWGKVKSMYGDSGRP